MIIGQQCLNCGTGSGVEEEICPNCGCHILIDIDIE